MFALNVAVHAAGSENALSLFMKLFMQHPMFTRGRVRRSAWRLNRVGKTASCYRYTRSMNSVLRICSTFQCSLRFPPINISFVQKGAKEFVDRNMLRSQRSRRRRRQQRPTGSSGSGPTGSAEEGKEGESDHETTSSSGIALLLLNDGFFFCFKKRGKNP